MIIRDFDAGFLRWVQISSVVLTAVAVMVALALQQYVIAAGLIAGLLVGIAVLRSLEWIVRKTMVPGARDGRKCLMRYLLLKYPLLAAILIPVVWTKSFAFILAFVGGLLITHLVIFLRAVGSMINQRANL